MDNVTAIYPTGDINLESFLDFLYGNEAGVVYLALKDPSTQQQKHQQWTQHFFDWPTSKPQVVSKIKEHRATSEVYVGCSLYKSNSSDKESVKGSFVYWVEFDGTLPQAMGELPEPTLRIRSSNEGHEHWYWRSETLLVPENVEAVNRGLTYFLGADVSGWDCTQVLRPPETINHKRDKQVSVVEHSGGLVVPSDFSSLPEPPPLIEVPIPSSIPAVEDVIARYAFPTPVWKLFREGVSEGQRSDGLMKLGYFLAQMNLSNEEMLSVLFNADERWGKFSKRSDQFKRLTEIVIKAKAKYPNTASALETGIISLGFKSVLESKIELKWVWEGFLQEAGYLLLTGPSGVGKTQFSLNFSADACLGKDFLDSKMVSQQKIGFFSLEMGHADLKYFLSKLAQAYSPEELDILEKNLQFIPLGEPLYLANEPVQEKIQALVEKYNLTGLVFDSLGSVSADSLSAEIEAKRIMDWNDHFRKRNNCFTVYIHHHRKASGDNKKPNKLADVYGSHYFTSRSTTTMSLWDGGQANSLQVSLLKIRLAAKPEPFNIYRDGRLRFTKKVSGITVVDKKNSAHEIDSEAKKKAEKKDLDNPTTTGGIGI